MPRQGHPGAAAKAAKPGRGRAAKSARAAKTARAGKAKSYTRASRMLESQLRVLGFWVLGFRV